MNQPNSRNYVAVLFITEDGKRALLTPEGDKFTVGARMSNAEPLRVVGQLCGIYDLDILKRRATAGAFEMTEEDGVPATYRFLWAVVKHPKDEFLRFSKWCVVEGFGDHQLSNLAHAAIAMARADGVLLDQLAEAA